MQEVSGSIPLGSTNFPFAVTARPSGGTRRLLRSENEARDYLSQPFPPRFPVILFFAKHAGIDWHR